MFLTDAFQQCFIAAAVGWTVQSHHLFAVMLMIITVLTLASDVQTGQCMHIFFGNIQSLVRILIIPINIFTVNCRNSGGIFRFFHAAFDLKRIDSRPQKFRNRFYGTHVLQA